MKKRVLSGIRPTGKLHLGNYFGAVKGMLALQKDPSYETSYMVADLHSINVSYNPETFQDRVRGVVLDYLSAGLDPKKSTIFVQSHVPEHVELAYLFSTVVSVARARHLPTYKEKIKEQPENVNMALLYYPILMAADILIYKANLVPVGDDQLPHLEVAREIARKMNQKYETNFPEPVQFRTKGAYIPSLLGEGKMSKSVEGSYINLADDLLTIKEKLAKVPTDSGKGEVRVKDDQKNKNVKEYLSQDGSASRGVGALMTLVEFFMGQKLRESYEKKYMGEGIRYQELKSDLAEAIFKELEPMQKRRKELEGDRDFVDGVIEEGKLKASKVARETLKEVKVKMGLG